MKKVTKFNQRKHENLIELTKEIESLETNQKNQKLIISKQKKNKLEDTNVY